MKSIRKTLLLKILSRMGNKYVIVTMGFLIWLLFLDANSYLTQKELNQSIDDLEEDIKFYQKESNKDNAILQKLHKSGTYEKIAREKYHMKKANEDVYIIQKKED